MRKTLTILAMALLAVSAFAKDGIAPGFDLWKTVGEGKTYMDFSQNPVPAGFFFDGSAAFTGSVAFVGAPLATQPVNALGGADTIVERLDAAYFNEQGTAVSGLRIKALSLVSAEPIEVDGSKWDLFVGLTETQPITEITYFRDTETTGRFHADLVVNVRLTFQHRVNKKLTYTLDRTVHFTDYYEAPYALADAGSALAGKAGALDRISVDVDGDGAADSALAVAETGLPVMRLERQITSLTEEELQLWHTAPTHAHLTYQIPTID